jgi:hypothetical protein
MTTRKSQADTLTPDLFKKVRRGEGTREEAQAIIAAIKDPRSSIHSQLGNLPEWLKQQFAFSLASPAYGRGLATGGKGYHRTGGQRLLQTIDYVMQKLESGQIADGDVEFIFSTGIPAHVRKPDRALTSHEYDVVNSAIHINLRDKNPGLADEINRVFTTQRGR